MIEHLFGHFIPNLDEFLEETNFINFHFLFGGWGLDCPIPICLGKSFSFCQSRLQQNFYLTMPLRT